MSRHGLWAIGLGLTCATWTCGCQSTGVSADADSRTPSFGVDRVPRQTEPEVETAGGEQQVASSQPDDEETAKSDSSNKKGNLLTRLLPGRDKENPDRKPLPVSKRSAGTDDDSSDDDDDDFEF